MGFFDTYEDTGGGGVYIKGDEKKVIAESGIPFTVTEVINDDENMYEGKKQPRFVLVIDLPSAQTGEPEERKLSFPKGTVESRDRMLSQMAAYLATDSPEDVVVKLAKVGRSFILQQA